jgi:GNAT superfamily N-acetyltransferase
VHNFNHDGTQVDARLEGPPPNPTRFSPTSPAMSRTTGSGTGKHATRPACAARNLHCPRKCGAATSAVQLESIVMAGHSTTTLDGTRHMSAVSLRTATRVDAPLVSACVCAAYERYIERIGKPPESMLVDYARVVEQREVTVAVCRGVIVGVLVLGQTDEGFQIISVAVHPSFQKQGLGRTLLRLAEAEAVRRGHESICLSTNEKMVENQALYSKIGYVEYDRRIENGYSRVYMRKRFP